MASEQLNKGVDIIRSVPPAKPDTTVGQMRAAMEKVAERVAKDVTCETLTAGGVPAEWIVAPGAARDRVILYLHGGGYVMGSINTHRAMIARISRAARAKALALEYRLAPAHPFAAAGGGWRGAESVLAPPWHPARQIAMPGGC